LIFAEKGFEGTSLRAVTQLAGVSVSAANYHFGSKEALVLSVLVRRLAPLNERRLARLDALEAATPSGPVEVSALLEAFLQPIFEALQTSDEAEAPYRQLAARLYSDPHEQVGSLKTELFRPVIERFVDALVPHFAKQTREEILLRFHFVVGVMLHAVSGHCLLGLTDASDRPVFSDAAILERMVNFAEAGLLSSADPLDRTAEAGDNS
jgi:AcrR family transcriptional regulator